MSTTIVELRRYLLRPGQRDRLIDLFDREFVETQEAVGMSVLGQFRDPDRPDHFVWLRGFDTMVRRHDSLSAFYDGPVWKERAAVANSTMIDSDDVLLLRPLTTATALPEHDPAKRASRVPRGLVFVVIEFHATLDPAALARFRHDLLPGLEESGARTIGLYVTEPAVNTFERLPVRSEAVIVWFGAASDDLESTWAAIKTIPASGDGIHRELHRLLPTARSALDGATSSMR